MVTTMAKYFNIRSGGEPAGCPDTGSELPSVCNIAINSWHFFFNFTGSYILILDLLSKPDSLNLLQ
uniref:Uncharacterized protein n=1 Tax=Rhizophora mucronata TaxID=61149 RepID=A0A2P2Q5I6_RHIMU